MSREQKEKDAKRFLINNLQGGIMTLGFIWKGSAHFLTLDQNLIDKVETYARFLNLTRLQIIYKACDWAEEATTSAIARYLATAGY